MKNTLLSSALLLLIGGLLFHANTSPKKTGKEGSFAMEKIKGVCWEAARDSIGMEQIQSLENYHVNWISQTPFGWQRAYDKPEIGFHGSRGMWGERDTGLIRTALLARQKGIKTLLKPHIWLNRSGGKWRSDIEMNNDDDWNQWFSQYEQFILHYARLAEANNFEALCIGTELYIPAVRHEQKWRDIIARIREVYSGQLTYAANFYKEYEEIQFWDALDFIGLQAYFPLTDKEEPSAKILQKGWSSHCKNIKRLHEKWHKPVIFTEVGYRSSKDAAIRPWEWEQRGEVPQEHISSQTQARCYEAMFKTFWLEDWIAGIFLWKWTPENYGHHSDSGRRRRPSPVSFTPKEEGLEVIREWFGKAN